MGTTDLHGNVLNWDYFKNAEYDDAAHNDIGLAKISTLVTAVRDRIAAARAQHPLLLDAGDTIQGTPLAYYFARIEPITGGHIHPMAAAMNADRVRRRGTGQPRVQLRDRHPAQVPAAVATSRCSAPTPQDWTTGRPVFPPYVMKRVHVPGEKPITVGILGLTNPGIAIWDKANVESKIKFGGIVELAKIWVPRVRKAGADVVIVSAHSGMDLSSSYGDALPFPENASALMAEQVPGIDAVLVGHAHLEIPERLVTNKTTGEQVVLTEPLQVGHAAVADRPGSAEGPRPLEGRRPAQPGAEREHGRRRPEGRRRCCRRTTTRSSSTSTRKIGTCNGGDVRGDRAVGGHRRAGLRQLRPGRRGRRRPWPVRRRPRCRCSRSPRRSTGRPRSRPGDVSVRDVAGLYIFDNTLLAVTMTGAQVKDYLEFSAQYFKQVTGTGPFPPTRSPTPPTPTAPTGTPDYNYDIMGGLTKPLTYKIDIAQGGRVADHRPRVRRGRASAADQQFVVAVNNYRAVRRRQLPARQTAPAIYNRQVEIRQLMIDYVTTTGTVDPRTSTPSTGP